MPHNQLIIKFSAGYAAARVSGVIMVWWLQSDANKIFIFNDAVLQNNAKCKINKALRIQLWKFDWEITNYEAIQIVVSVIKWS